MRIPCLITQSTETSDRKQYAVNIKCVHILFCTGEVNAADSLELKVPKNAHIRDIMMQIPMRKH